MKTQSCKAKRLILYYLYFIPLLLLYIILTIFQSSDSLTGDESRYIEYARNLLSGFYSPPFPNINLWNGPGYPLLIAPILLLFDDIIFLKLVNALFLYCSVILLFKSLILLGIKGSIAIKSSYIFGLGFPIIFTFLPLVLTEIFSIFLFNYLMYFSIKYYTKKKIQLYKLFLPAFFIGFLSLTKIIFGYVFFSTLIIILFWRLFDKKNKLITNKIIVSLLLSYLFTLPYLAYTYTLTGKFFYWGNSGGKSLYWMSTPYKHESGNWFSNKLFITNDDKVIDSLKYSDIFTYSLIKGRNSSLYKNHHQFINTLDELDPIQTDFEYRNKAIENMLQNPPKFIHNWIANVGRILFHYPFSYTDQTIKTYIVLIPSMILIFFFLTSIYPAMKNLRRISLSIKFLFLVTALYFLASSILSAYSRMFFIIIPFLILFSTNSISRFLRIRLITASEKI